MAGVGGGASVGEQYKEAPSSSLSFSEFFLGSDKGSLSFVDCGGDEADSDTSSAMLGADSLLLLFLRRIVCVHLSHSSQARTSTHRAHDEDTQVVA